MEAVKLKTKTRNAFADRQMGKGKLLPPKFAAIVVKAGKRKK
jgi:hypothetical protein